MAEVHAYNFPKAQKVWGRKNVDTLFAQGRWGSAGELKYCWLIPSGNGNAQEPDSGSAPRVMVSVPKRFFKRAVKRNLLKRRIREAYRLQKNLLEGKNLFLLFAYNSNEILDFGQIYALVGEILKTLAKKLDATA